MKIIIVSAYFFPEIEPRSFRTTSLVNELSKKGHDITVCIPYREFDNEDFLNKNNVNIVYLTRNKITPNLPKGKNIFSRIVRFSFGIFNRYTQYPYIKLVFKIPTILRRLKRCDLLISIAAPHVIHWGCAIAVKNKKICCDKWIADCGDPFMGDQTVKKPFYFKYFEHLFCRNVDFITIPIVDAINAYYPEYRSKIRIIPQGFDISSKSKYIKIRTNECPTFAYAGSFYPNYRDPSVFLEYLTSLNFEFKFILYTKRINLLDKYITKLGHKIEIRDYIPREELLDVLSQMDFLINFENSGEVQSPSKLIDYALTNRPIFSVKINYIDKDLFLNFISGDYPTNCINVNLDLYDIRNVTQKFLDLC